MIRLTRHIGMRRRADPTPYRPARRTGILTVPVLVLLVTLAAGGCAGDGAADQPTGSPGGSSSGSPGGSPSEGGTSVRPSDGNIPGNPGKIPRVPATEPPAKAGPTPSGPMTLTGTVTAGVEPNCLLLNGYLLVDGPRDVVTAGARISVTGRPEPDLMSTCQQGIPFRVASARAA